MRDWNANTKPPISLNLGSYHAKRTIEKVIKSNILMLYDRVSNGRCKPCEDLSNQLYLCKFNWNGYSELPKKKKALTSY